jgi:diaminopimelate epimerase
MRFTKMHGAGNDYVYVDGFAETVGDAPALARAVSDRTTGIGSDGLILLLPSEVADVRMVMFNADGSRAQMCGNGIRCLAKLARDRGRSEANPMQIETDAGTKVVELRPEGIRVDMGSPRLAPASLPVLLPGERIVDHPVEIDGETLRMTCVSMGNPHAVLYVDDVEEADVAEIGPALERHPLFPERVNVSFVQVVDRSRVLQRTWERGSGETQACGTGACAVCVAGVLTGRTDGRLVSRLPGGELLLEWDGTGSVFMTGPAVEVFTGEWKGVGG